MGDLPTSRVTTGLDRGELVSTRPGCGPAAGHTAAAIGLVIGMAIGSLVSGSARSAIRLAQAGPAAPRALEVMAWTTGGEG
jgi:hypothetical protein